MGARIVAGMHVLNHREQLGQADRILSHSQLSLDVFTVWRKGTGVHALVAKGTYPPAGRADFGGVIKVST